MGLQHTNRKGDVYYLQVTHGKNNRPRYYFSRKLTGAPVEEIPEGYEIYEKAQTAQVYLRKPKPTDILPAEKELVEIGIRQFAGLEHFIVETEKDALVVYLSNRSQKDVENMLRLITGSVPRGTGRMSKWIQRANFSPMMRFVLVDQSERFFSARRWCFGGMIDGWITISGPGRLEDLVEEFVPHLEEESFFEQI